MTAKVFERNFYFCKHALHEKIAGVGGRGKDKPRGDILPQGKVSPETRYHAVSCPHGQDTGGDRINLYTGSMFLLKTGI